MNAPLQSTSPWLLLHIKNLGLHINKKKSKLDPSQVTQFLGMTLDPTTASISLTTQWREAIRACLHHFCLNTKVSWRLCLRLMGLMAVTVHSAFCTCNRPGVEPPDSPVNQSLGYTVSLRGTSLMEEPTELWEGQQAGPCDASTTPGNRCLTSRLGSYTCRPRCLGCLDRQTVEPTNQCSQAPGNSPCTSSYACKTAMY